MNNEQDDRFEKRLRFVARRYKEGSLDEDKAWERFAARQGIRRQVAFRRYWMVAASVVLLLIGFGTFYMKDRNNPEWVSVVTASGQLKDVYLPDSTLVSMAGNSTLRYDLKKYGKERRVVEMTGKVFFQVKRNEARPFSVHTALTEVTVLGTSFNVSTYREDNYWQTTLVEGSVWIAEQGRTVVLKPSEQYTVDRCSGQRKVAAVDAGLYTSWVDGKFYFKAYTFEEIVKKLERWYDFTMVYQDEEVKQMRFTGSINKHSPVTEVLRFLEMTTGIRFKVEGKQIVVSKI